MCSELLSALMFYALKSVSPDTYQLSGLVFAWQIFPKRSLYYSVTLPASLSLYLGGSLRNGTWLDFFFIQSNGLFLFPGENLGSCIPSCLFFSLYLSLSLHSLTFCSDTFRFLPSSVLTFWSFHFPHSVFCLYERLEMMYFLSVLLLVILDILTYVFNLNYKVIWNLY